MKCNINTYCPNEVVAVIHDLAYPNASPGFACQECLDNFLENYQSEQELLDDEWSIAYLHSQQCKRIN